MESPETVVSGTQAIAEQGTILRGIVGSTVHGLALAGTDDTDEMGVCLEPREYIIGLKHFEQWVYRTQPEGARSGPGDLDLVIYSLRKYARLALNGNPTILLLFYSPYDSLTICTPWGDRLRELAPAFASRLVGQAFLGYLRAQRQRLLGERGGRHGTPRADLVERYGYDTKYAMHMLRLGYQGREFMTSGRLTLPMPEPERGYLRAVRGGTVSFQDVLMEAGELEQQLRDLLTTSPLPETPDHAVVDRFLIEAYQAYWNVGA